MYKRISWNNLLSIENNWAYLAACQEREIDDFVRSFPEETNGVVRTIRGQRCVSLDRFFQEWAAALQFPYYFGENWNAFDECLNDLEWIDASSYNFFITQLEVLLRNQDHHFKIMIELLEDAAVTWSTPNERKHLNSDKSAKPFHIVFHCNPKQEGMATERLKAAGVTPMPIRFEK